MHTPLLNEWLPLLAACIFGALVGAALVYFRVKPPRQRPGAGRVGSVASLARQSVIGPGTAAALDRANNVRPLKPPRAAPPLLPVVADLLVVDDSAVARTKLRRLFEAAGYVVQLANDGEQALALLRQGRYAILITDLEMPHMDGVALIKACKADAGLAAMPILAISGHESLRARFNECRDICGVHRKPWADDILLSHVATLVSRPMARLVSA